MARQCDNCAYYKYYAATYYDPPEEYCSLDMNEFTWDDIDCSKFYDDELAREFWLERGA